MDVIELTRQLGLQIQKQPEYIAVATAGDLVDADPILAELISEFADKRELISYTENKEQLEKLDKELEALYNEIMKNPKMQAFETAKHKLGHLMDRIIAIITKSADGADPNTAEPDEKCDGDCCSCHSCGD